MSGFPREYYTEVASQMRARITPIDVVMGSNISIILAALDIAAADPAPRTAEPEADGDRTVHPALEDEKQREVNRIVQASLASVPATELLRRVTELEKLVNELSVQFLEPKRHARAALINTRNAWLKSRAGEWV